MNPVYITAIGMEIILAILMIVMILLHAPKADGMGGIGGTATVFTGKRGAEAGLDRLTWIISLMFMFICFLLGFGFIRP